MRQIVSRLVLILFLGACASSHSEGEDGGARSDAACEASEVYCVGVTDHQCHDAFLPASCIDGEWQCPRGSTPEWMADCWCYGSMPGCTCTPSGWSCPEDGGVTDGCPSDFTDVDGMPCADEGLYCGCCTDPCSFCNLLHCTGGRWQSLEAFPQPDPCVSFACGSELRCNAVTQFCVQFAEDGLAERPSFRCEPYPDECRSCDCLSGDACEGDEESGITVTRRGA